MKKWKILRVSERIRLLTKGVSEAIKNEAKEKKEGFLIILLGNLCASLLGNLLTGKGTIRVGEGAMAKSRGRGTIRAGENFYCCSKNIMNMSLNLMVFIQEIIY